MSQGSAESVETLETIRERYASELDSILEELLNAGFVHPPLSANSEQACLRALATLGLLRWCPYPDECYVFTPEGTDALIRFQER